MVGAVFYHYAYPLNKEVKCWRCASIGLYESIVRYLLAIGQSIIHLLYCMIYRQRLLVGLSGWKDLGIIDEHGINGDNHQKEGTK